MNEMECPVDGTVLETHTFYSVSIEECRQCRGLWFEEDELRKTKDEAKPVLNWLDFDLWSNQDAFAVVGSSRRCPQCGKNMAVVSYASTGITVDYCVEGHGVWLQKGDFESIIDALHQETLTKNFSEYVAASLKEAKEIITGDEGFISEWKDFLTVTRLLQHRILADNPKFAELLFALQSSSPFR
jgi:Zn-finger nucleic acid-binding protein